MISYSPLWETLKKRNISKYFLRSLGIGGGSLERLRKGEPVSTHTLDIICKTLNCMLSDVAEFVPDEKPDT